MEKQFVPYEIALTLKELGFNEPCFATYRKDATASKKPFEYDIDYHTKVEMHHFIPINSEYINDWISAPLYQQAFRWFREKHHKHGWVTESYFKGKKLYQYHISRLETLNVISDVIEDYNEAELACLKKLIEIVKSQ